MQQEAVCIVGAKRSPIGAMLGQLSSLAAPALAATSIQASLAEANFPATAIEELIGGCVLQAGIGQAPARQAAIAAGIPTSVPASTINKMCGSGMKALMLGYDSILAGSIQNALCFGMESMSNAPYLLKKARSGYRMGHGALLDHLFLDGLEDAYEAGKLMGVFADRTASALNIPRDEQDAWASRSMQRALAAQEAGYFSAEIAPVVLGEESITQDECPSALKLEKISRLRPAFDAAGTVTAGNSSAIADGAASLLLVKASQVEQLGLKPLARIVGHASYANDPAWFTTAPAAAIQRLLKKIDWSLEQVDLFEINEAFAVVALACVKALELNPEQVNIHGGACALGHPIGASGARIVVSLLHALRRIGKRRGVATACIGGGEATAIAIELLG